MPVLFSQLHIPLRLLCGGLLFTCNAVMWTFLAKALRYSSSSTWTTVTTTASNFISSVSDTSSLSLPAILLCVFLVWTGPESVSSMSCRLSWASWSSVKPRLRCGGLGSRWPWLVCWCCSGSRHRMDSKTPSPRMNNEACLHPLNPCLSPRRSPLIHTFSQRKGFG